MAIKGKGPTGFGQIRLFSLYGFEVSLDLSWLLLALLISWSVGAGLFPQQYPGLSSVVYAWMGIAVAVGVFFSIVFHEFSHSLVARHFGMQIRGITLFVFGGVAKMASEPPTPKSEFLMAAAGPVASFLLAYAFLIIERFATASGWPVSVIGVADTMSLINLTVALFNLVPAFPLDGGRMLRAALWRRKGDLKSATYISSQIGQGFGLALAIVGILSLIGGNLIGGMWLFLIGLFVRGAASASYQQLIVSEIIRDQPVSAFMRRDPVTVPPSISIDEWLQDYVYQSHYKMYPVVKESRLMGCISIDDIKALPKRDRPTTKVAERMQPCSPANTILADTSTAKLLTEIVKPRTQSRYMVVEDGQLVGMISLKDLLELISLKLEVDSTKAD